ncbi:MAG: hypothetical protein ACJ8J0_12060 [Longimicrobiaceae bacterium]
MKLLPRAALLLAAALLPACAADEPATPQPGDLTVTLATQNTDAAMIVAITGPGVVGAVQAVSPGAVARARTQGTTTTVAVLGAHDALGAGPLLRISVPDVRQAKEYAAVVREAADLQNAPRASLAGYALTVER